MSENCVYLVYWNNGMEGDDQYSEVVEVFSTLESAIEYIKTHNPDPCNKFEYASYSFDKRTLK